MVAMVLIADEFPLFALGVATTLSEQGPNQFKTIHVAQSGVSALGVIHAKTPDIAIVDFNMKSPTARQILAQAKTDGLQTSFVVVLGDYRDSDVFAAVEAGAKGLLLRSSSPELLMACMRTVAEGGTWHPPDLVGPALARERDRRSKWAELSATLTTREREIVALLLDGPSTREVAKEVRVTEGTAKVHINNIFRKLQISSRAELLQLAVRNEN